MKIPYPMRCAMAAALKSNNIFRVGACLVRKGIIVGVANNKGNRTIGICAERRALKNSGRYGFKPDTIYVARVLRIDGSIAIAKPCARCFTAIKHAGIKKIIYTDRNNTYGELFL